MCAVDEGVFDLIWFDGLLLFDGVWVHQNDLVDYLTQI